MTSKKAALTFTLCLLVCFVLPGAVEADGPQTLKSATPSIEVVTVAHSKPTLPDKTEEVKLPIPLSDELVAVLVGACKEYGVPLELAVAVMERESQFTVDAVGRDGHDIGLFQLRDTYHWWLTEQTGADPMEPAGNIRCGVWLLGHHIGREETVEVALTAYRYGHNNGCVEYAKEVMERASKWESVLEQ